MFAYLLDADGLPPIKARFFAPPATANLGRAHAQDDIARLPVRRLVTLALEYDFMALGHAGCDLERVVCSVIHDLLALTVRALVNDDCAASTAFVATKD